MSLPRFVRGAPPALAAVALLAGIILSGCASNPTATPTTAPGTATPVLTATPTPAQAPTPTPAPSATKGPVTLTVYGAGTLANPFGNVDTAFHQLHQNVTVQPQFGGSVKMAKQITQLNEPADVLAVADFNVIPKYLYSQSGGKAYANWYAGFVSNAITFAYTDKSKGASEINSQNWYQVLAEPGVEIGRSSPDTDPSGYQTLQMLALASKYYNQPDLEQNVLKNAPEKNIRDTETSLIAALETGQIDYLAIYRSDAIQHNFHYLDLPPQINLSDASLAAQYATVSVQTANGNLTAAPIIYAVTIPTNAPSPNQAERYVAFLLGDAGQSIMKQSGFVPINPPIADGVSNMPAALQQLVTPWPKAQ